MPQELIDKFIDDLWFEGDTDTVKTLSQTSRLFLHRCRRHLFSYIRLSSESSTRQSQRVARKAKNLEDVLVRIPEIANYVQRLFLEIPRYNVARAHIISRLLLRLSMINESHVDGTPSFSNWTLFPPKLQSVISHLAYSPRMKIFNLHGIYNFPISFFTSCTSITDLSIRRCGLEDHASLGNPETRSIARLHTLDLCGTSVGVEKLICGGSQDGFPILDVSHLQELRISIPEALPALQEIFKRAPKLTSLRLEGTQRRA